MLETITRRTCPGCQHTLPLDDFGLVNQPDGPRTLQAQCRRCEGIGRSLAGMRAGAVRLKVYSADQRLGGIHRRPADRGCSAAPACLSCPFARCRFDGQES